MTDFKTNAPCHKCSWKKHFYKMENSTKQLNIFERKVYRRILGPVYDNEKENWKILTNKEIYASVKWMARWGERGWKNSWWGRVAGKSM